MEWRCANCGEPHQRNSPPCHECGHMRFERAVVRLEWECDECGELATTDVEPCERCGNESFTRRRDPRAEPEPFDDEVRVRQHAREQQLGSNIVWDCESCGKRHMRNSPPCSRCGHATLEKVVLDADPDETAFADADGSGTGDDVLAGFGGLFSSALSVVGLFVAAVGGLVMLYGGLVGAANRTPTGAFPPGVRLVIFGGFVVLAVGGVIVLFSTRQTAGFDDGPE